MDRMMEQLTQRMAALMGNQIRENPNPNPNPNLDQEESGDESEGENYFANIPRRQQRGPIVDDRRRPIEDDRRRWESGMLTEIPEFHGSLKPEESLDWPATVDEILEFKRVPEDKRVPLVAIRLRDRVTAWWQYAKLTRSRLGKPKIVMSKKMKKHLRASFLPYNFQILMYQLCAPEFRLVGARCRPAGQWLGRRAGPNGWVPGRARGNWAAGEEAGPRGALGRRNRWAAEDFGPQPNWAERAGPVRSGSNTRLGGTGRADWVGSPLLDWAGRTRLGGTFEHRGDGGGDGGEYRLGYAVLGMGVTGIGKVGVERIFEFSGSISRFSGKGFTSLIPEIGPS
ncbi:hypothetical protein CRG98_004862 [Punica granatum]|uniref:Retrotransposon gag domain-containing protein n=1 Tax=Punica granatum TaxID=22663 RepID=A0A2I0L2A8_PUNGR|nr:hypothetical protein CRG98_004862 [Punica granatum]